MMSSWYSPSDASRQSAERLVVSICLSVSTRKPLQDSAKPSLQVTGTLRSKGAATVVDKCILFDNKCLKMFYEEL
jgi:hypothetical protein